MDILIIGAGLTGSTIANRFAKEGKKVLILEKRNQVAGNVFDKKKNGVFMQQFGPHIFHSDIDRVYEFMNEFWELNSYKHTVKANVKNMIIPLPFNFVGIEMTWPDEADEIKAKLLNKYGKDSRVSIIELMNETDKQLKKVAKFVYENIFLNYTTKMWGKTIDEIDPEVVKRVPVVIGYNDRYFSNKYEGIPKNGFHNAVLKMLDHENIELKLNVDAKKYLDLVEGKILFKGKEINVPVIYSGPIDDFFQYRFGPLSYRSLDIKFEEINKSKFQESSVINYPADPEMTRISEYNYFYQISPGSTIISREYPGSYDPNSDRFFERYYPMMDDKAKKAYGEYEKLSSKYSNFYPAGRLGVYKYLDMDKTINLALELSDKLLKENNEN